VSKRPNAQSYFIKFNFKKKERKRKKKRDKSRRDTPYSFFPLATSTRTTILLIMILGW
jgi:hypothetical protein